MEERIKKLEDQIADIQRIFFDVLNKSYQTIDVEENIKELDAKTDKLDERIFQLQELCNSLRKQLCRKICSDWILTGTVAASCIVSVIFWFLC